MLDRKHLRDARSGDLAVVRPGRGRARVERVVGPASSLAAVLEALLEQEGLRAPFEPYDPPEPPREGRIDLRDLVTFTVDPDTAKDFDDAISARAEGDGIRMWVHIADVSAFVPAGSPLDVGASHRGNSVYVPGRVAPMLPPQLAEDLCSLRPHVDRLCLTVEVPFDAQLDPGEPLFYRSVISSDERLTYGRAQAILAGEDRPDAPEVGDAVALADRVARELRRRRFARGALRIMRPELSFAFDDDGQIERAWLEAEPQAHALVEELMILANEAVAGLLSSRNREALYRVHENPDPQAIALLVAKLADLGVPTPPAPDDEHMTGSEAAALAHDISERVTEYVRQSGRGRGRVPDARPAVAQAGALRPAQPRAHGPREPRVLPLHVADPALSRPRMPSCAAARARRLGRAGRAGGARRRGGADLCDRARSLPHRVPSRRDLHRVAARARAFRARLGRAL